MFCVPCTEVTAQAKLKTLHEVVVRNRLEQLRKRQRDEALQAQEELLAGVAKSASRNDGRHVVPVVDNEQQEAVAAEDVEEYHRSMSPELLDIRRLPYEERQIDIVTAKEDLRALVSLSSLVSSSTLIDYSRRWNNGVRLQLLALCQRPHKPLYRSIMTRRLPVMRILPPRLYTVQKPSESWTKRKSCSTLRRILPTRHLTTGRINIDLVSLATSIACTRGMNGTSTTKHITSKPELLSLADVSMLTLV